MKRTIRSEEQIIGILQEHEAVAHLKALFGLSERRACEIAGAD